MIINYYPRKFSIANLGTVTEGHGLYHESILEMFGDFELSEVGSIETDASISLHEFGK
jgi:hypothetical protein